MLLTGIFDLSWWAYPLIALGLTHLTIAAVTIYLHRQQTHRALDFAPGGQSRVPILALAYHGHGDQGVGGRAPQASTPKSKPLKTRTAHRSTASPACCGPAYFCTCREARDRDVLERYGRGTPKTTGSRTVSMRGVLTMASF